MTTVREDRGRAPQSSDKRVRRVVVLVALSVVALIAGAGLSVVVLFELFAYGACTSNAGHACNYVGSDQILFVVPVFTVLATGGAIVWASARTLHRKSSWWLPLIVVAGELLLTAATYVFITLSTGQAPFFPPAQ